MGKSHRNVGAGSCSKDYNSPHNRGFAREKKAHSHHSIRTHNNNCDDDTIQIFNCKCKKMNYSWAASYYGEVENIPNFILHYIDDKSLNENYGYKWNKNDTTLMDTINTIINGRSKDNEYLTACKKQIERRGNVGRFYGHRFYDDIN